MTEAGHIIAQEPVTLQLRYLQTLTEIATEKTNTLVFPIPIDLISMFLPKNKANENDDTRKKNIK